jgi:hypothetical protein
MEPFKPGTKVCLKNDLLRIVFEVEEIVNITYRVRDGKVFSHSQFEEIKPPVTRGEAESIFYNEFSSSSVCFNKVLDALDERGYHAE